MEILPLVFYFLNSTICFSHRIHVFVIFYFLVMLFVNFGAGRITADFVEVYLL